MSERSTSLVFVHLVWSTKHRQPVLNSSHDKWLVDLLEHKAREKGCTLVAAGCSFDHVHALLGLAPAVPLADLIQRLKGSSSHAINHENPLAHQLRWQTGYWVESVSPSSLVSLTEYVRSQRQHHTMPHPEEDWHRWPDPDGPGLL